MRQPLAHHRYNVGEVVHANENPELNLVIRRYIDRIYYCRIENDPENRELAYFERELVEPDKS